MKKIVVLFSITSGLSLSAMASDLSCKAFEPSHTALLSCNVAEKSERLCILKDVDNSLTVATVNENAASVIWTFENVEKTSKKLKAHDQDWFGLNRYDVKLEVTADGNGQFKADIVKNDYAGDRSRYYYSATLRDCQKP